MLIRVGLEHGLDGQRLAWALDFPGCFANGAEDTEVMLRLTRALVRFEAWLALHTEQSWFAADTFDFRAVEVCENFKIGTGADAHEVFAFFEDDRRSLSTVEVERAALVYRWQREELLAGLETLDEEQLDLTDGPQGWSIQKILIHIARVDAWYISKVLQDLNPLPRNVDLLTLLSASQELVEQALPRFSGNPSVSITHGETWSCRKCVRRLLWHQRDHIDQIRKIVIGAGDLK